MTKHPETPPLRDLSPRYHEHIDTWLRLFGAPNLGDLLDFNDWIFNPLPDLDQSLRPLYLEGAPGTGKTLLGSGLARLWTLDGPMDFEEALLSDSLRCPIIADDISIYMRPGGLFFERYPHARVMLSSNVQIARPPFDNALVIHVNPLAADLLRKIGAETIHREWVEGDAIARHLLWRRDLREFSAVGTVTF